MSPFIMKSIMIGFAAIPIISFVVSIYVIIKHARAIKNLKSKIPPEDMANYIGEIDSEDPE